MDTFCLVLAGHHLDHNADAVESRLAAAFGMTPEAFRDKVWRRAPLIIRRTLDEATARAQAAQLQQLGTAAAVHADDGALIWLLRGDRVLGPLPADARGDYARPDDRWCHDGDASWQALPLAATPPPLPRPASQPPPLPARAMPRGRRRTSTWLGGVAVASLAILIGYLYRAPAPAPATPVVRYVPRPLQPMVASASAATMPSACPAGGAAGGEEDRFLITGGQRVLTGRARRSGDAYVAEAIMQRDAQCQPSAVQLYMFRRGVFVGTVLDAPIDPRHMQLTDFTLDAQGQLTYSVRRCDGRTGGCGDTETYQAHLQRGDGGWVLAYGAPTAPVAVEIISRPPPHYPEEAIRQRHQGTVLLVLTIGTDGLPRDIAVAQSSGFAELDAAAVASARQWRFRALRSDGGAGTATARVPVRFHLSDGQAL
jgi:TonB family protein